MPTENALLAAFLLPHQDDEFGVFEQIHLACEQGLEVQVWFFTTGVRPGHSSTARAAESLRVLARLGVPPSNVLFAGDDLGISDGELQHRMDAAAGWLAQHLGEARNLHGLYVPAWEGGHPDHDALHAVAVSVSAEVGALDRLHQFHLYNAYRRPGPFFTVLSPLKANGPLSRSVIPWPRRLRYLGYCLGYPSQWGSWLGLFPFAAAHYLFRGVQELQPTDPRRLSERPHPGPLYYEKRKFSTWDELSARIKVFCDRRFAKNTK